MALLTFHSSLDIQQEYNDHFFQAVQQQCFPQVQRLLKLGGVQPCVFNNHRRTAFMELFFQPNPIQPWFVQQMIQAIPSLDINEVDHCFQTILHGAVQNKHINIIPLLVKEGIHIDSPDLYLRTPLMYAVQCEGNGRLVQVLLKFGANPNYMDNKEFTPLMYAVMYGDLLMVKTLIEHGANIHYVSQRRQLSAAKLALLCKKHMIYSFLSLKGAKCYYI